MPTWVCANCGERYDEHNPPCLQCAGEEFALLDESDTDEIGATTQVEFRCTSCGRTHPRRSPPCSRCGGMDFETVTDEWGGGGAATTSTSSSFDGGSWPWLSPPGPFQRPRNWLWGATKWTVVGGFLAAIGSGAFGSGGLFLLAWGLFSGAILAFGVFVVLLLADNVLGYVRHG